MFQNLSSVILLAKLEESLTRRSFADAQDEVRNLGDGNKFTPSQPLPHPGKELFPRPTGEGRVRGQKSSNNVILRTQSEESRTLSSFADGARIKLEPAQDDAISCHSEGKARRISHKERGQYFPQTKAKFAFTLAEVLITLGVIGTIAAMTIPSLIEKYQKDATVSKLKRAISVLNQAYKLSYDDLGEKSPEESKDMDSQEYFNTYWAPYIKVHQYCTSRTECGYNTYTPFTCTDNSKSRWYVVEPRLRSTFMTPDGFVYVIFLATWVNMDGGRKLAQYQVIVDLNGGEKPNKFGRDVFWLSRVQEDGGGIRPYCYEKSDTEVKADCSKSGTGECCAERIKRDGWKIVDTYPWK